MPRVASVSGHLCGKGVRYFFGGGMARKDIESARSTGRSERVDTANP